MAVKVVVITVSDRCARGVREDRSGPLAAQMFTEAGFEVAPIEVITDGAEVVAGAIAQAIAGGARVVFTSGGTGVSDRDETPEGTIGLLDKTLPGVAEAIRAKDAAKVPTSAIGRGVAGVSGQAFVVNAPGSVGGVRTAVSVILPLISHILSQLDGSDH